MLPWIGLDVSASDHVSPPPLSADWWQVGQVIDGQYDVLEVIDSGGPSVVYRVHHRGWDTDLAVKAPHPGSTNFPDLLRLFETRARTWLELGLHPNVVACLFVRRLDGVPRIFAEWVDGGSLSDAIASGRL